MSEVIKRELSSIAQRLKDSYRSTGDEAQFYYYNRVINVISALSQELSGSQDLQSVTDEGSITTRAINTGGITSDYFQADTAATPTLYPGMMAWNEVDGTMDLRLKGNNVTLQLGQETVVRVVNKTGADLLESEYSVVRVRIASEGGAQGQRLAVVLAQGDSDPDSVTTLGIVTENINNNQEGFITVFGNVSGINTTGSLQGETWVDGDVLFLSPTTPGKLTKVKPTAPNHTVVMGYVIYAHANNGKIFVKVDNGYEIGELHDVNTSSQTSGQLLRYNGTVWENWTPDFVTISGTQTITGLKSFARTLNILRSILTSENLNTVLNQNTLVSSGFILNGATNAPISGNLQYINIGAFTIASTDASGTDIYIRKLYSPTNFTAWTRLYTEVFHPEADKLTTARQINGTNFDGTGNITTANWGTARTITIGGTAKSVNGSGNVSWNHTEMQTEYQIPINTGRGTLTDPTLREIALSHGTMSNKIRFISPTSQEESTDGINWTASTRATSDQLADLVRGEGEGTSFVIIPGGTIGTYGGYRLTWDVVGSIGYVFFNQLYMYLETRSNPVDIVLERYHNTTGWEVLTGPHVANNWPGHYTIPHTSTPYSGSSTQYSKIRITFGSTRTNTNSMSLMAVEWYGTYPNQRRNVESYDRNKNVTFPAEVRASGGNSTNWNTAYSWGDHASAGYTPQTRTITINGTTFDLSANRSWTIATGATALQGLTDVNAPAPNNGDLLRFNGATNKWENFSGYTGTFSVMTNPPGQQNLNIENGIITSIT